MEITNHVDITMLDRLKQSRAYQAATKQEKAEMLQEFFDSCEIG